MLFCQQNSPAYHNCYSFYRSNPSDKFGTFEQIVHLDSFRVWYGTGSFVEKNRFYTLKYKKGLYPITVNVVVDSSSTSDSVFFSVVSVLNNPAPAFYYNYLIKLDSFLYMTRATSTNYSFSVPKSVFINNALWLNDNKETAYILPNTKKSVSIFVDFYSPLPIHFITPSSTVKLRKNKKGFKVKALFSGKRKEQFVSR